MMWTSSSFTITATLSGVGERNRSYEDKLWCCEPYDQCLNQLRSPSRQAGTGNSTTYCQHERLNPISTCPSHHDRTKVKVHAIIQKAQRKRVPPTSNHMNTLIIHNNSYYGWCGAAIAFEPTSLTKSSVMADLYGRSRGWRRANSKLNAVALAHDSSQVSRHGKNGLATQMTYTYVSNTRELLGRFFRRTTCCGFRPFKKVQLL